MLACGGHNHTAALNQCWTYDPLTNSWGETSPMNRERHFGSVVRASGSLVVVGGRDGSTHPMAMGGIEQYEAGRGKWSTVETRLSMERSYQCAVSLTRWGTIYQIVPELSITFVS